ncbi:MAG TPA: hypothetical protein VIK89_13680 [Cytophagaceae bacterium]
MNEADISKLCDYLSRREQQIAEVFETHISWVILSGSYAYKIKKPIVTTFLNFKTLASRKSLTEKELRLNKRLAPDVYIAVKPVIKIGRDIVIGASKEGKVIDYVLVMKRLDNAKRMDRRLAENKVSKADIIRIARKLSIFHSEARPVKKGIDINSYVQTFDDLGAMAGEAEKYLGKKYEKLIAESIRENHRFINSYQSELQLRIKNGFVKDVHGDLHTANIFLYKDPVIYDCIEFNDSFRRIDLLSEVAFLCMDMERWERVDLSELFFREYLKCMGWKLSSEELNIFNYYKSLRANIRAKVCLTRMNQISDKEILKREVRSCKKYLELMKKYMSGIK